jgi:hypothetical protein
MAVRKLCQACGGRYPPTERGKRCSSCKSQKVCKGCANTFQARKRPSVRCVSCQRIYDQEKRKGRMATVKDRERYCTSCHNVKLIIDFHKLSSEVGEIIIYGQQCEDCFERQRNRRNAYVYANPPLVPPQPTYVLSSSWLLLKPIKGVPDTVRV